MPIPKGLTRKHVLVAIGAIDAGTDHGFGPATKYALLHEGKTYPPKAVVGLAANKAFSLELEPGDFSAGESSNQANSVLRKLGFEILPRSPEVDTPPQWATSTEGVRRWKAWMGLGAPNCHGGPFAYEQGLLSPRR